MGKIKSRLFEAKIRLALRDGLPVLYAGDGIEQLLGYSPDDLLSSKVQFKDRIHPQDSEIANILFSCGTENRSGRFNLRFRHADGHVRCLTGRYRKEAGAGGSPEILNLLLQDAKSLHQDPKQQFIPAYVRAMLDHSLDLLVFKDLNHVLTGASQTLLPFYGATGHWTDLLGKTDYDLMPEPEADLHYELEKDILAGQPSVQAFQAIRFTNDTADDRASRSIDIRKYPVKNDKGEIVGVMGIARDCPDLSAENPWLAGGHLEAAAEAQVHVCPGCSCESESGQGAGAKTGRSAWHISGVPKVLVPDGVHEELERVRQALVDREFVMYYQPKVNMSTGKVVGAEALIRWQHPERGLLTPAEFLPLIERHPLSVQIGDWVIDTVLSQMETWIGEGMDLPISVNIGAMHLQQPDFIERLSALLAQHPGMHAPKLELEILETSAPQDVAKLTALLTGLRQIGVSFALDDFGTGSSSLNYLKQLPANILKIDRSFVRDILDSPEDMNILEGVLGLAAAFNRQSLVAGVETVDQGLMLLRMGCELAQGYCIARPMPANEFPHWAATWKPDPRWAEAHLMGLDDRPLLETNVEHRSWILAIEAFLKGETHVQPQMSRHQCRFGLWLDAESQAGRNSQPAFQSMVAMHWRMHAMATGILKFQAEGRNEEGLARLGELTELLDKSLELLKDFRQQA